MGEVIGPTKEQLVSGFEPFLRRHIPIGDSSRQEEWITSLDEDLVIQMQDGLMLSGTDEQLVPFFESVGRYHGPDFPVKDTVAILSWMAGKGIGDRRTLTVGCGLAPYESYLSSQGIIRQEIVATDAAQSFLDRAKAIAESEGLTNIRFNQSLGASLQYNSEFGQVFIVDSLHWMLSWRECIKRSARALQQYGDMFLVYIPNYPRIEINPFDVTQLLSLEGMNVLTLDRLPTIESDYSRIAVHARKEQTPAGSLLVIGNRP